MALTKILTFTREYYRVPVSLSVDGEAIDPTGLTIEWAVVVADTTPIEGDWLVGDWETISSVSPPVYLARTMVGDDTTDFPLIKGQLYDAYMRITDSPERPARLAGQIQGT